MLNAKMKNRSHQWRSRFEMPNQIKEDDEAKTASATI